MKTTPTAAIEAIIGLPPLPLMIQHSALLGAYRIKSPEGNLTSRRGDHTEIFKKLEENQILAINPDCISRTPFLRERPFRFIRERKEFWGDFRPHKLPRSKAWFTDGSKTSVGTEAGIYVP